MQKWLSLNKSINIYLQIDGNLTHQPAGTTIQCFLQREIVNINANFITTWERHNNDYLVFLEYSLSNKELKTKRTLTVSCGAHQLIQHCSHLFRGRHDGNVHINQGGVFSLLRLVYVRIIDYTPRSVLNLKVGNLK